MYNLTLVKQSHQDFLLGKNSFLVKDVRIVPSCRRRYLIMIPIPRCCFPIVVRVTLIAILVLLMTMLLILVYLLLHITVIIFIAVLITCNI